MLTKTPQGLDEIIATFGDIDDPDFEAVNIVLFDLPYPLLYDSRPVHRSRCHRLLVDNFVSVFSRIRDTGLELQVKNYGGIYNRRSIRGRSAHPSTHSWGIAIDLEPHRYPLGSMERFPEGVIEIFAELGFVYGGDFISRKDPMHWQFASHY